MASPAGPEVGAFFDLDGTLVAGFTGVIPTSGALPQPGTWVSARLISMVAVGLSHQFGRIEFEALIEKATDVLRGRPLADLEQIGEKLFRRRSKADLPGDARSGAGPPGARAHRGAQLLRVDHPGGPGRSSSVSPTR